MAHTSKSSVFTNSIYINELQVVIERIIKHIIIWRKVASIGDLEIYVNVMHSVHLDSLLLCLVILCVCNVLQLDARQLCPSGS